MNEKAYISISQNDGFVLFSSVHVPFEPKTHEQTDLKNKIRETVDKLPFSGIEYLCARYGTTDSAKNFFDVENVLFYNIGMSKFRKFTANGIHFAKVFPDDIAELRLKYGIPETFCHYYEYRTTAIPPKNGGKEVYRWENQPFCGLKHNAADYWRYFRKANLFQKNDAVSLEHTPFAIRLKIEKPASDNKNIANDIKPMLDGMICAFHRFADMDYNHPVAFFADSLGETEATIRNETCGAFGEKDYVQYYERSKNKVKWNPADDRLIDCSIQVVQGNKWRLSGSIATVGIICPFCGSTDLAEHIYGLPIYSEEDQQKEKNGEIIFDGCCIEPCAPKYRCRKCKEDF